MQMHIIKWNIEQLDDTGGPQWDYSMGILGFLNYGPCSLAYELTKAFHSSVQFFWPAQTSQIYLTLGKLEDAGLVTHGTVIQNGKPNKMSIPSCPPDAELQRWLSGKGKDGGRL